MSTDAEHRFDSLVTYLRHLVDDHGIAETAELWKSGREQFDALHAGAHAPTFEDGLSAGWARAVEALTGGDVSDAVLRRRHDQRDLPWPCLAGNCRLHVGVDEVLIRAARALTERGPT